MNFLLAFQFLTIFPIRISRTVNDEDLVKSMRWYPLVGAFIGALSAALYYAALQCLSFGAAVISGVVGLVVFSGALHLDGFADTCDGFYGRREKERILAIMKDSRCGAMAIIGIFCLLAFKIALLGSLEPRHAMLALIAVPAVGRWSMVWLSHASTYARAEGGTGSAYIGHVDRRTVWFATLLCAVIVFLLLRWRGLLLLGAAFLGAILFRCNVERRIGGMTGDTLGAYGEFVEVLSLAVLCFHGAAR